MRDIERVIERVRAALPDVRWEQLKVAHPGVDDDGIWYFSLPDRENEVKVESSTGMCPFDVDDRGCAVCGSVETTADSIVAWLRRGDDPTSSTPPR